MRAYIQATVRLTVMCLILSVMGAGVIGAALVAGAVLGRLIP